GFAFDPAAAPPPGDPDPRLRAVLRALFEPVCQDYQLVAEMLGAPPAPISCSGPRELVRRFSSAFLPNLEEAWEDLSQRGILRAGENAEDVDWGPQAELIEAYRAEAAWPEGGNSLAAAG
ncbi:MAG: hypothetical protein ACREP8_14300, partial [Candidatus Binatia bacterium]